jgi:WD40 repeat protein
MSPPSGIGGRRSTKTSVGILSLSIALVMGSVPGTPRAAAAPSLSRLWMARYDGSGRVDVAQAMKVSPDGSTVFATGYSFGQDGWEDYATVAYDAATGVQRWAARYDGPYGAQDVATALGVSADGSSVYVTGYSYGSSKTTYDFATVAYDAATGRQRWVARYVPGDGDFAYSLVVSPDGATVYVTGSSSTRTNLTVWATVAYDAATGARRWLALYDDSEFDPDAARDIGVSPDGKAVFVTGYFAEGGGSWDYGTVAYEAATGTQRWVARFNGRGNRNDLAWALAVSPDGSTVFVTGQADQTGSIGKFATVAYDTVTGTQRWVAEYRGPENSNGAVAVGVSPDGGAVFVTGSSRGEGTHSDFATVAYDAATGVHRWVARYNGPDNLLDAPSSLGVSPDGGTVAVTGYADRLGLVAALAVVEYDADTGVVQSMDHIPWGSGRAVAFSPTGTALFVAGAAGFNGRDFVTVAYSLDP